MRTLWQHAWKQWLALFSCSILRQGANWRCVLGGIDCRIVSGRVLVPDSSSRASAYQSASVAHLQLRLTQPGLTAQHNRLHIMRLWQIAELSTNVYACVKTRRLTKRKRWEHQHADNSYLTMLIIIIKSASVQSCLCLCLNGARAIILFYFQARQDSNEAS